MKTFQKYFKFKHFLAFIIFSVIVLLSNYFSFSFTAKDKMFNYDTIDNLPYKKVGLVLGTSPDTKDGLENIYFTERLEAAKYLLENKKVEILLVSGDNRQVAYNEPKYMTEWLIENGVASTSIISDFAGRRTLDSVVRAKEIFGQYSLTIISQEFHNERALYLAEHSHIDAVAFSADKYQKPTSSKIRMSFRELLSRAAAVIDIFINRRPEILGYRVEVR